MTNPRSKARIEARILERAAHCVEFELSDPRSAFITITKVEVSNDLGHARIHYSVLGTEGDRSRARHMLEDATGFIRRQVGRVLKTRRIPQLAWHYDDSQEFQEEMERKIQSALERDRTVNPGAHPEMAEEGGVRTGGGDDSDREYLEFLQAQEEEEGPP